jgi:uncharacterized membrane protein HdeD (DUF308 family)
VKGALGPLCARFVVKFLFSWGGYFIMANTPTGNVGERKQNKPSKYVADYGDIIIDLGKLVFAGVILNVVINGPVKTWVLLISGVVFTIFAFVAGVWLKNKGK